uniref:Reverse transcriptase Ty1/copia-type domain-containing protein n=1 Tax=Chromera velia CCMP2878 TaxID=1169474 RepID=A0A0K6S686_9ALVE|eukprot:Cvel_15776.t2-p1 / transcript=Cvel_15776.t2 / gene=Cvel_15776 / organism=Chromera_velia_CCMP2878 / gene_product=hypothetical protein / transcript_product=hypothetical protein / location=Cvel_scaffold1183:18449-29756(-) / protein_length=407 / sequence_SO=supercontig / SO=protein_coding / is_pseudo=false
MVMGEVTITSFVSPVITIAAVVLFQALSIFGTLTGRSSSGHPRPCASGPSRKRPHYEHKTHRPEDTQCLKQHYCSDCDHWGYKTGDCNLTCDHFALLRAYGYSRGGGRSGGNGGGQRKRGRQSTGSGKGRTHQQGGALTGETNESEASDADSKASPAAAAVGYLSQCIYPNDSPHPNPVYVVSLPSDSPSERPDTSVGSPHQAQQQQPQQSSNIQCPSDQPPSPKFDITDFGKDELILWQDENTGRCFLGSIRAVDPEEVDAEHRRSAVPTHFVDTKKRVEEGSWKYKSRVVADGTPFFDCREGVTTFCATASQSAMRIALAIAFAHSDFDPREIVVADVKTAYLTALRSDSLYVHPPTDYPDHGKFLWLLNRALYGLRDSGNLWDRSRNKTLAAAGWVPSSVRRMW